MIFKTFDSDIDKWAAKIGVFGKSFNAIFEAKNQRKIDIDDLVFYKGVPLDKAKNQVGSFWSYLFPKKEDIQKQIIDVDALLPKIDESKANKILDTIKSIEDGTNAEIKSFQELYDTGDKQNQWIAKYAQETQGQIRSIEGVDKANQAARASALAHNEAIKAQTLSAKAGKVALQALATAGNMLAGWLITKALQVAATAIDNWIHRVEKANEAMNEAVSEYESAKSSLESINSELENQNKKIDDLLAKDKLTYSEKGQLEELQAITKELLLQQDIEERRAGLASKEAADKAVDAYEKQYGKYDKTKDELEEKISYDTFPIIESEDDVLGNVAGYIRATELLEKSQKDYQDALNNGKDTTWLEYDVQYYVDVVDDFSQSLDDNISDLQEKRATLEDEYNKAIEKQQKEVEPLTSSEKNIIATYESICDVMKMVYEYTNQNDWNDMEFENIFNTEGIEKTKEELTEMSKSGKLTPEMIAGYKNLNEAIQNSELFLKDGQTAAEAFCEQINALNGSLNYDNVRKQLMQSLGFGDAVDNASEAQLWNEIQNLGNEEVILKAYLKVRDQYGKHPEGWTAKDWISNIQAELETESLEVNAQLSISQTIDQLNTHVKPALDSLKSAWQDIFTDNGTDVDIDSMDILSICNSIKSSLDEMSGMGLNVDYSAFDDFVRVLNDSESETQDVKNAFDALATSITRAGLSGAEDFETMKSVLADLGVVNEDIVAFQALAQNTEALKESGLDLTNAAYAQLQAFAQEKLGAENAAQGIAILIYQQMLVSSNPLNAMASIQALANLGGKAAETAGMLAELAQIMARITDLQTYIANNPDADTSLVEATLGGLQQKAESLKSKIFTDVDFTDIDGGTSKAGSAGSAAGDAYVDAFEEELSELEQLRDDGVITEKEYLDRLRILNEKYFKDKLGYEKEFAKYQRQYLEGYKSLYESALSGISKLMSSRIESYTESKEAAIESLEAEKQAAEDAYQAQIDAIDDMIDKKKDIIDGIQDEIDAMKEARAERQRQIDLQKAQYELARMTNQRTILQYSEDKGMHYVADTSGIRDTKEKVDDAKFEIEVARKEKQIKFLEDEIDLLERQKDSLAEAQEASNKYYDSLIKQQENYWDSMIRNMEQQKSKWEELAEIEGIADAYSKVKQVFNDLGYTVEDVLNGNEQAFEDFKSKYISILSGMNNNSSFAEGLTYATGAAEENLGSFLDKTKETADGISDLSAKGSELDTIAEGLSDNLNNISSSLSKFPESENISNIASAFTEMGIAVKDMADALGTEGEEASGLIGALQSLSDLSLSFGEMGTDGQEGTGILSQFQNLKGAVDDVTNAITGGGTSSGGNAIAGKARGSAIGGISAFGTSGEGAGGLIGAINSIKDTTETALGAGGAGSEEGQETLTKGSGGAIGQFGSLKEAVDEVTKTIGSEDEEGEDTLIGALRAQYDAASEILPEEKGLFDELLSSISACALALGAMVTALGAFSGIGSLVPIPVHSEGTVGNAFAKGTGKYKGLPKNEKNALRSEYGQPELTVYPDGTAELTTSPIMSDLPKGTVIFNEEQTKRIMNNKPQAIGNAYADGTNNEGWITLPDGQRARPLRDGDTGWNLMQKFQPFADKMLKGEEQLINNAVLERQKQMESWTRQINNANISNNNIQPNINVSDIHITCPGVTSQEVVKQVGAELSHMFSGLHLDAMQQSMLR